MPAKKILIFFLITSFNCATVFGGDEDPDIDAIEAEFARKKEEPNPDVSGSKKAGVRNESAEETQPESRIQFKDLSKMAPFSEVSIIQKKFLPMTNRFQFHLGLNHLSNNPFYDMTGLTGRLAFYFTETIGVEATLLALNHSPKYVTEDLKEVHGILASSIVSANKYYGLDLMLIPFYGKITWLDKRIIPFDFYLSLGLGKTGLTDMKEEASTFHVAVGQIYALTKNFVVRWDLSGNMYRANVPEVTATGSPTGVKHAQDFRDVFLGGGVSFLFPGAGYR